MAEHQDQLPDTTCPRQLFGLDLHQALTEKLEKDHNLIVMGDFNSEYSNLTKWMQDLGLVDLIEKNMVHVPRPTLDPKMLP